MVTSEMEFSYYLFPPDILSFEKYKFSQFLKKRILIILPLIFIITAVLAVCQPAKEEIYRGGYSEVHEAPFMLSFIINLIVVAFVIFLFIACRRLRLNIIVKRNKELTGLRKLKFLEDKILLMSEKKNIEYLFSGFISVAENAKYLYLFTDKDVACIVPKYQLPNPEQLKTEVSRIGLPILY